MNKYDLEERTSLLGERVVAFCKKIERSVVTLPIINQLMKSSTSIGANYHEANGASSRKDFRNKISICEKEARETRYWMRIMKTAAPEKIDEIGKIDQEVYELILIFGKILSTMNKKDSSENLKNKN